MDSHEPDFIVVGEKVALGPLRRDLADSYARWMNQLEVRRGLDQLGIATPQSQERWVEENIERGARREPQTVEFAVHKRCRHLFERIDQHSGERGRKDGRPSFAEACHPGRRAGQANWNIRSQAACDRLQSGGVVSDFPQRIERTQCGCGVR